MSKYAPIAYVSKLDSAAEWVERLSAAMPDEVILDHRAITDPGAVDLALVAAVPSGALARFPNLKRVASLWAGVDSMLTDPTFPRHVVLSRLICPVMTTWMVEIAVAHTLAFHRGLPHYRRLQAERRWHQALPKRAEQCRVGLLGLGTMGERVAAGLNHFGFDVAGWSRRPKQIAGVTTFAGADGLRAIAARSDVVINLLPLTADTRGILSADLFQRMPDGSAIINLARGGHLVEADLIAALDHGRLSWAALDVFEVEPLPADNPLWAHPKIDVTPHVAALSDPISTVALITEEVRRYRAGEPPTNTVDMGAGY